MNTHYFRYFKEVVLQKSFTKAAKNLHMSQQSLSEHIKRMEEHYGVKFFVRKPTLHLTHAGELFLEYVERTLCQEELLLAEFSYLTTKQKGKIRVGITPTRAPIFFPLIFAQFNKLYPLVELSLREDHTSFLVEELMDGKIDCIIGLEDNGIMQNKMITSTTLLRDRKIYFLASREILYKSGFPSTRIDAALKDGVKLSEIQTIPLILNHGKSKFHSQIAQEFVKQNAKPKVVIESSNVFPLLPLCSAGDAGGFMSQTIFKHVSEQYPSSLKDVLAFPVQGVDINCDTGLMHFCNKPMSVHFKEFVEVTMGVFAEYKLS